MQFRVPQFIDIEDKILGPLGWKQLAYIVAGLGLVYIIFRVSSSKLIATILSIPALCIFGALAFIRINNRDFLSISEDAVKYFFSDKIYTWQKDKNSKDTYITSGANALDKNLNNNTHSINNFNTNTAIKKTNGSNLSSKAFAVDINSN